MKTSLFYGAAVLAAVLATQPQTGAADLSQQLAIQTWTLRNLNFDQVIDFAKEHGIRAGTSHRRAAWEGAGSTPPPTPRPASG